ncbi:MAG: DUF6498-containing protein [Verrucomicrobiota bacterium]
MKALLERQQKPEPLSSVGIVLSNLVVIALALIQDWDLRPMLIIYWAQSVIIGGFNFVRMILLRDFTTKGLKSNGRPVPETSKGKWSTAVFFAFHYGIFHLVYLGFIAGAVAGKVDTSTYASGWDPGKWDVIGIGLAIVGFFIGHGFSFINHVRTDLEGRPNLGTLMFLPYARIVPMHLTIIFGFSSGSNRIATLVFVVLKTGADWLMHVIEHRVLSKKRD